MQPNNTQLPNGFIAMDQAIELIKKDTPSQATVDLDWMANNIDYIQEFKNFQIPLARNATQEEIDAQKQERLQHPGMRIRPIVITEKAYVQINDVYEKEALKRAIRMAYKSHTGREVNVDKVHNKTTVFDPEHNSNSRPMVSKYENTEKGADLGRGEVAGVNLDGAK